MSEKKTRKKLEAFMLSKLLEGKLELLTLERERLELAEFKRRLKLQRLIHKRKGWKAYVV
ncbi:MAG: hypothetical protein QXH40_03830 [Candidatus Bathyarchaeia archaeon]